MDWNKRIENKEIIRVIIILLSIVNIVCIVWEYTTTLKNGYLKGNFNIPIVSILIIIFQIFNIAIGIVLKKTSNKKQKALLFIMLTNVIISAIIPIKEIVYHENEYGGKTDINPTVMARTKYIYINLYGTILKEVDLEYQGGKRESTKFL